MQRKRFEALDAFRGIMACAVVILHTTVNTPWLALPIVRNSFLAVDFFFILSGFVICMTYADKLNSSADVKKYAIKRFLRLWPLHFVVMIMLLALNLADYALLLAGVGQDAMTVADIVSFFKELAFLHVFDSGYPMGWNFPAWSISAEIVAYITFAIIVVSHGSKMLPGLVAAFVVSFSAYLTVSMTGVEFDTKALQAVSGFCLGAIIADLLFRRPVKFKPHPSLEFVAIALLLVVFSFYGKLGSFSYPVMMISFAAILYVFAHELGVISDLLKRPVFQKVGLYSYAIYIVHVLVMLITDKAISVVEKIAGVSLRSVSEYSVFREGRMLIDFGNEAINFFAPIAMLLIVIAVASVCNRTIELPWMARANNIAKALDEPAVVGVEVAQE